MASSSPFRPQGKTDDTTILDYGVGLAQLLIALPLVSVAQEPTVFYKGLTKNISRSIVDQGGLIVRLCYQSSLL